jgi:hypothetical protein
MLFETASRRLFQKSIELKPSSNLDLCFPAPKLELARPVSGQPMDNRQVRMRWFPSRLVRAGLKRRRLPLPAQRLDTVVESEVIGLSIAGQHWVR